MKIEYSKVIPGVEDITRLASSELPKPIVNLSGVSQTPMDTLQTQLLPNGNGRNDDDITR